jgi:S-DNA-T family DNA segregation ATPase FtsK/SpoIIIE
MMDDKKKNRILGLLLFMCAILVVVSLISHDKVNDTAMLKDSFTGEGFGQLFSSPLHNKGGIIGAIVAYALFAFFGYLALLIPLAICFFGYGLFFSREMGNILKKIAFTAIVLYLIGLLFSLGTAQQPFLIEKHGLAGALGHYSAFVLKILTGSVISYTIVISLLLGALILVLPSDLSKTANRLKNLLIFLKRKTAGLKSLTMERRGRDKEMGRKEVEEPSLEPDVSSPGIFNRILRIKKKKSSRVIKGETSRFDLHEGAEKLVDGSKKKEKLTNKPGALNDGFRFPDVSLLSDSPGDELVVSESELKATAGVLKETLGTFGVELGGDDVEIYPGPIITRFEFKPAPGIKIVQIVNLADDLALAMKAKRVRIVAPIPGKSAVGVEIPNRVGQIVYLKEVLTTDDFQKSKFILPLALGKNTSGKPFVVDLAAMPHLLIAGATGSGKSVCLNSIITSLLFRHSPETVRLIMIDPKMLELSVYNDLPHLEKPVVTEMKYAEKVLAEAVVEMEERYRKLAKLGVRNIIDFNEVSSELLPFVIIIVDELADLMMIGSGRIEALITRLAQMARAVGIHLILATQRPSVDVITGLIKANFSTRIAFQVATKVDSRTIIDINGAEKLLGRGDMLYMNPALPEPKRAHGAFIPGSDIQKVCNFLGSLEYKPEPIDNFKDEGGYIGQYDPAADALFKEAIELVIRHKQGSVSLLQRRLGIGYQRAARLIDQLEESGIVGPYDGSKAREVLVDETYLLGKDRK